ncbi:MAG TPA: hypothetical protein VFG63_08605 [Nocardioidaceae bacterium]|nr:hypothetical protein [Nocardioidaceae bacterium]
MAVCTLTACSTPDLEYAPSIGSNDRTATIQALNLAVVTNGEGVGTLVGALLNEADSADRLVGVVAVSELGPIETAMPTGPIKLPEEDAERLVQLAPSSAVTLRGDNLRQGFWIDLTLRFDDSAELPTKVPVEAQAGPYADIEITASPDGKVAP